MAWGKTEIRSFIARLSALMEENKEYLISLDSALGDGDLGLTMSQGFAEAASFAAGSDLDDLGKLLAQTGMAMSRKVPSTMGTLMASGFMGAGKALKGLESLDDEAVGKLFTAFTEGVKSRGKAAVGDRTIVDALQPGSEALAVALGEGKSLTEAAAAALEAAERGRDATASMKGKFGRAVYFGDQVLGKVDQGAVAGALIFRALKDTLG